MASLKVEENKLYITHSCGILAVFGVPLAVMGGVVLQLPSVSPGVYALGLLVLLLGLMIAAGRKGIILDRESSRIITWWGLWIPFIRSYQPLDSYDRVELYTNQHAGINSDDTASYPIRLVSDHQPDSTISPIYQSTDLLESRIFAEHIAYYVDKPLENSSMGAPIIRQPTELQKNLADQSKPGLLKQNLSSNKPLNNTHITVSRTALGTEISLLPCGLVNACLIFMPHCIVAIVIGIFIMGNMSAELIQQSFNLIIIFSFLVVTGLIHSCFRIGNAVRKIIINNEIVKVHQPGLVTQSDQFLKIQELEEIFISELSFRILPIFTGNMLSLISATRTINISGIKSTEELYQLKQIITESIGFELQKN